MRELLEVDLRGSREANRSLAVVFVKSYIYFQKYLQTLDNLFSFAILNVLFYSVSLKSKVNHFYCARFWSDKIVK